MQIPIEDITDENIEEISESIHENLISLRINVENKLTELEQLIPSYNLSDLKLLKIGLLDLTIVSKFITTNCCHLDTLKITSLQNVQEGLNYKILYQKLKEQFENFPRILHLTLSMKSTVINEGNLKQILGSLNSAQFSSLQTIKLKFPFDNLGNQGIKYLSETLPNWKSTLQCLDLKFGEKSFSNASLIHLKKGITELQELQTLSLDFGKKLIDTTPIFLEISKLALGLRCFKFTNITPQHLIQLAEKLKNLHTCILKISPHDNFEKAELMKFLTTQLPLFNELVKFRLSIPINIDDKTRRQFSLQIYKKIPNLVDFKFYINQVLDKQLEKINGKRYQVKIFLINFIHVVLQQDWFQKELLANDIWNFIL